MSMKRSTSTILIAAAVVALIAGVVTGKPRTELTPGTTATSPAAPGTPGTPAAPDPAAVDAALNYSVD